MAMGNPKIDITKNHWRKGQRVVFMATCTCMHDYKVETSFFANLSLPCLHFDKASELSDIPGVSNDLLLVNIGAATFLVEDFQLVPEWVDWRLRDSLRCHCFGKDNFQDSMDMVVTSYLDFLLSHFFKQNPFVITQMTSDRYILFKLHSKVRNI